MYDRWDDLEGAIWPVGVPQELVVGLDRDVKAEVEPPPSCWPMRKEGGERNAIVRGSAGHRRILG